MHKPIPVLTIDDSIKVWNNIFRQTTDVCWPWALGCRGEYPNVHIKDHGMFCVSRIVYKLHYGKDPGDNDVCHDCDNPICCNPHHLFLGSHQDNMADKMAKGREPRIFSDAQRELMRSMREEGKTLRVIAEELGCHHTTVLDALRKRIR